MKRIVIFLIAIIGCSVMSMAEQQQVNCGESVTITATPREHYHFLRWNDGNKQNPRVIENVTGNMSFTAIFAKDTFRVVFNDYAGNAVFTDSVAYLDTPVYGGTTPTKPSDAQYDYAFDGWNPNIGPISGDQTYNPVFTQTLRKYEITFVNDDGTVLQQTSVDYGTTPQYTGPTPTKDATAQYTYTFSGWDREISPVTGEQTYTAQYESTVNEYEITFFNEDGTLFYRGTFAYGDMPQTPTLPTKDADAQHTYTFAGWSPAVTTVTGATSYTATFSSEIVTYSLTVVSDDPDHGTVTGTGIFSAGTVTPISATATDDCWEFDRWSDGDTNASRNVSMDSDITLTAYFKQKQFTITITSDDETMGTVSFAH